MAATSWDAPVAVQAQPSSDVGVPSHVTETDGLGVSLGVGAQYVLLGIQAAYYFQVPDSLYRVAPYAAVGIGWCAPDDDAQCALSFGVLGSWGHKHRALVDLGYGPLAQYRFSFYGEAAHWFTLSGPSLSVGYEYMAFSGFFLRTDVGVGYLLGAPLLAKEERPTLSLTIVGLGWKLW